MDLYKNGLRPIRREEEVGGGIASIEELQRAAGGGIPPPTILSSGKRPGCKSLGPAERQEVSTTFRMPYAT